ncbi:MAG: ammonium transporter [Anaerolineales bacterium]|jgi:Amt family ammonium transporter|nr:ammonium transporter [Anaerolineales bacterium]
MNMLNKLFSHKLLIAVVLGLLAAGVPHTALAAEGTLIDSGDTAWIITASVLVLFMTIPGLSLFYAGLVRAKNVLSIMMQNLAVVALITVLWIVYGYSVAFGGSPGLVIGGFEKTFLNNVDVGSVVGTIPETVFMFFQLTFAIITPALIIGAFAERMKFSAFLWFMGLWFTFVYLPVCHSVWGPGGWMAELGVLDFAGGSVVHVNAGIAGLIAAIVLGKRKGYPTTRMPANSVVLTMVGAAMLWVGWFGFNAGSGLAADGVAGMAATVTQIATATATLTWMFIEWSRQGKPSGVGLACGAVAGLVAITPASGYVGPVGALAIGFAASAICYWAVYSVKSRFGYDDALDVFGVHGVGGFVGAIMTGVFASVALGGSISNLDIGQQLGLQAIGAFATLIYSGIVTFVILKIVDAIVGLRVSEQEEDEGLDLSLHGEEGFNL